VVLIGIEAFKEVPADEVREVRVTYPLTKAMGTVWVVRGYSRSDESDLLQNAAVYSPWVWARKTSL